MYREIQLRLRLLFFILIGIQTFPLYASKNKIPHNSNHLLAAELSVMGQTQNFTDPYSLPVGFGILYEYHGFNIIPAHIGIEFEWFGFIPLNDYYGDSAMILPSVILGYSFKKALSNNSSVALSPFISSGIYFRSFEINGETYKGRRPAIKTGFDIMLITEKKCAFSIGLFYSAFLENNMVSFPGYRNRIGYAF